MQGKDGKEKAEGKDRKQRIKKEAAEKVKKELFALSIKCVTTATLTAPSWWSVGNWYTYRILPFISAISRKTNMHALCFDDFLLEMLCIDILIF